MINKDVLIAYIKILFVVIVFGSIYFVAKYLVTMADASLIAFLRFFITALILIFFYIYNKGKSGFKKPLKHWFLLFLTGFFFAYLYNMTFFESEFFLEANLVAILFSFTPCLTVILGIFFLREKGTLLTYLGIIIALIGTIEIISFSDNNCRQFFCLKTFSHFSIGYIFAIMASFSMAFYSLVAKKAINEKIDSITISTFSAIFGAILLFINNLFFKNSFSLILKQPLLFWVAISYTAIFGTVIAYKWYIDALKVLGINKTAVFLNGVPLSAMLIGVMIFDSKLSLNQLLASLVIITGVIITNYSKKSHNQSN